MADIALTKAQTAARIMSIGDVADLQTKNKENLVAAINEVRNSGGGGTSGGTPNAVQYIEQTLTDDQQTQARKNIGAASAEDVSKLSADKIGVTEQIFTEEQKAQARANIDAKKVEGTYELIETITVEEETAEIVRTEWPDGTPYAFSKVTIQVHGLTASGSNGWLNWQNTNIAALTAAVQISGTKNYSMLMASLENGAVISSASGPGGGVSPAQKGTKFVLADKHGYFNRVIDKIRLIIAASFAVGTVIEIWGVRADV